MNAKDFQDLVAAFRRLGVDELLALELAEAEVSPHYLGELLDKGWTIEQAVAVVL